MSNTEIFELCEITSKKQCPDFDLYWEIGIVYCSCGRCLILSQKELRRFVNSKLHHQKGPTAWCQTWSFRAATNVPQSQGHVAESSPTPWWEQNHLGNMAQRWQIPRVFVKNWVDWKTNHSVWRTCIGRSLLYCNTRESVRNEKSCVLKFSKESTQGPTKQRPDFVEAKREMKRLRDEFVMETPEGNTPIDPVQRARQRRGISTPLGCQTRHLLRKCVLRVAPHRRCGTRCSKRIGVLGPLPCLTKETVLNIFRFHDQILLVAIKQKSALAQNWRARVSLSQIRRLLRLGLTQPLLMLYGFSPTLSWHQIEDGVKQIVAHLPLRRSRPLGICRLRMLLAIRLSTLNSKRWTQQVQQQMERSCILASFRSWVIRNSIRKLSASMVARGNNGPCVQKLSGRKRLFPYLSVRLLLDARGERWSDELLECGTTACHCCDFQERV